MATKEKDLVIVESPAKAETIKKFLGSGFNVIASKGHIMDLPKSDLGVDIKQGFKPTYIVSPGKGEVISNMAKMIPKNGTVYIASDPDREGEAIGWHIAKSLKLIKDDGTEIKSVKNNISLKRVVFHEITKDAILESFNHARTIDMNLVDAQQARRILDRLVGYKLSPLLWQKIRYGLSAGRVQSVAVRFIVDRERERDAFISKEYWSIEGQFKHDNGLIKADLQKINGKKIEVGSEAESKDIVTVLNTLSYAISKVASKRVRRHPAPPFITSTLQQEAIRKLGWSAKQTMRIAQRLYEGVETGNGRNALITYMRTDSYNLSTQSLQATRAFITETYGEKYLSKSVNVYTKKSKLAQEAHEAIRPVNVSIRPEQIKNHVASDEAALYDLIWKRTVATQMADAEFDALSIEIEGNANATVYMFKATGQKVVFPGFISLYFESKDDSGDEGNDVLDNLLPAVTEKDEVKLSKLIPDQHFTQPPGRFTEATLVKTLEENGIGRPSTYAPIISTIMDRGYVEKEAKAFKPLDVGVVVNNLLEKFFPTIVDIDFTSNIEKELDDIAIGEKKYKDVLDEFYTPFETKLTDSYQKINKEDIVVLGESDEKCPDCGGKMVIKLGKYGKFLSCANFPECKGMKGLETPEAAEETKLLQEEVKDMKCETCGSPMVVKASKQGIKFYACSTYPKCKFTKGVPTGKFCELCATELVERKNRWGKSFFGCPRYPDCKFILNETKKEKETIKGKGTKSSKKKVVKKKVAKKATKKVAKKTTKKTTT